MEVGTQAFDTYSFENIHVFEGHNDSSNLVYGSPSLDGTTFSSYSSYDSPDYSSPFDSPSLEDCEKYGKYLFRFESFILLIS
jgi:hypothetical protein